MRILQPFLSLDPRSLAAWRIALATVAGADLWVRAGDLAAHYTDRGTLLRADALEWFANWHELPLSLHLATGAWAGQALVFLAHAVFLACFAVGFRTRLSAFACWLLAASLTLRNPFLGYGADTLLRLGFFWAMLAPVGEAWSLDAALGRSAPISSSRRAADLAASFGLLVQVVLVLAFSALPKAVDPVWARGDGLLFALDQQQTVGTLGRLLRNHEVPMRLLSHATLAVEGAGAVALLLPWWPSRLVTVTAVVGLMAGIHACMDVGFFPMAMAASMLPFLPGRFWDALAGAGLAVPGSVRPAIRAFADGLSRILVPPRDVPARRRSVLDSCRGALALAAAAFVLAWNVGLWNDPDYEGAFPAREFGQVLQLRQAWGMFSTFKTTGVFEVPGWLDDGRRVDLLADGGPLPPLERARASDPEVTDPRAIASRFRSVHWLAMFSVMAENPARDGHFLYYARYLCREWNRAHSGPDRLVALRIDYVHRDMGAAPGEEPPMSAYRRDTYWNHDCLR